MAMENWRWFSLEKTVDQRNTGLDPAHGKSGHLSFRLRGRHAPGEHAQKKGDESGDIPYFLHSHDKWNMIVVVIIVTTVVVVVVVVVATIVAIGVGVIVIVLIIIVVYYC